MSDIDKAVERAVDSFFDDLVYKVVGNDEDFEAIFHAFQNLGLTDLADSWYNWCSDGAEENEWPNTAEEKSRLKKLMSQVPVWEQQERFDAQGVSGYEL